MVADVCDWFRTPQWFNEIHEIDEQSSSSTHLLFAPHLTSSHIISHHSTQLSTRLPWQDKGLFFVFSAQRRRYKKADGPNMKIWKYLTHPWHPFCLSLESSSARYFGGQKIKCSKRWIFCPRGCQYFMTSLMRVRCRSWSGLVPQVNTWTGCGRL